MNEVFSENEIYGFIGDYIHMSIKYNTSIRLSSSSNRLKEAYDKLAELTREKEYLAAEQNVLLVTTHRNLITWKKHLMICFQTHYRECTHQNNC